MPSKAIPPVKAKYPGIGFPVVVRRRDVAPADDRPNKWLKHDATHVRLNPIYKMSDEERAAAVRLAFIRAAECSAAVESNNASA